MASGSYDAIAGWYDQFVQQKPIYREVIVPNLLDLARDVSGQRICDIACGQGLATREFAHAGAAVTGVDISGEILSLARRYELETPLGIDYILDDAQTLATQPGAAFDGVACSMGLINIPDLGACLGSVRRILKPGGWFVFCITHPCFESPFAEWVEQDGQLVRQVRRYFQEGYWQADDDPERLRARVGDWHRMISTYVNTLVEAGFSIERMLEPRLTEASIGEQGKWEHLPNFLLIRASVSAC